MIFPRESSNNVIGAIDWTSSRSGQGTCILKTMLNLRLVSDLGLDPRYAAVRALKNVWKT